MLRSSNIGDFADCSQTREPDEASYKEDQLPLDPHMLQDQAHGIPDRSSKCLSPLSPAKVEAHSRSVSGESMPRTKRKWMAG
jgi:hypothetical protein